MIELKAGHKVYAEIPKHFAYANCRGDFSMCKSEATLGEQFDYLVGRYVVVKTATDGGGGRPEDRFPDGHHVWCESVDRRHKVNFYQTGCFTAMIPDIAAIGRAEMKWVVDGKVWTR